MIGLLADFVVLLVALQHLSFLVLEMFLWDQPLGLTIFRHNAEHAARTKVLAANQGLYNGFLAAGLFWSLVPAAQALDIKIFFLACVIVAGTYGAYSVNRLIFPLQAGPAILALLLVFLS